MALAIASAHRAAARIVRAEHLRRVDVGRMVERDREHAAHDRLEVIVAGDEVGFRIRPRQGRRHCPRRRRPTRPSAATRPLFLAALARPFLRSQSIAASISPSVSLSAFLQSIMPAPVFSRRSLTSPAVMVAMNVPLSLLSRVRLEPYAAAMNSRACSFHLSRAMRPLNLRSASSFSASSGVIAASCQ